MKKLILAVATVCVAGMVQAASVAYAKVSVAKVQAAVDAYVGGVTTYAMYVFEGTDPTAFTKYLLDPDYDLDAFKSAAVNSTAITATATDADTPLMSFAGKNPGKDYINAGTINLMAIIVDAADVDNASHFLVAKDSSSGNYYRSATFTTGDKNYAFGDNSSNTAWTHYHPIEMSKAGGCEGLKIGSRQK